MHKPRHIPLRAGVQGLCGCLAIRRGKARPEREVILSFFRAADHNDWLLFYAQKRDCQVQFGQKNGSIFAMVFAVPPAVHLVAICIFKRRSCDSPTHFLLPAKAHSLETIRVFFRIEHNSDFALHRAVIADCTDLSLRKAVVECYR